MFEGDFTLTPPSPSSERGRGGRSCHPGCANRFSACGLLGRRFKVRFCLYSTPYAMLKTLVYPALSWVMV